MESTAVVQINSARNELYCDYAHLAFLLMSELVCSLNLNVIDSDEKLLLEEKTYAV